jgi:hypothetical protein
MYVFMKPMLSLKKVIDDLYIIAQRKKLSNQYKLCHRSIFIDFKPTRLVIFILLQIEFYFLLAIPKVNLRNKSGGQNEN